MAFHVQMDEGADGLTVADLRPTFAVRDRKAGPTELEDVTGRSRREELCAVGPDVAALTHIEAVVRLPLLVPGAIHEVVDALLVASEGVRHPLPAHVVNGRLGEEALGLGCAHRLQLHGRVAALQGEGVPLATEAAVAAARIPEGVVETALPIRAAPEDALEEQPLGCSRNHLPAGFRHAADVIALAVGGEDQRRELELPLRQSLL